MALFFFFPFNLELTNAENLNICSILVCPLFVTQESKVSLSRATCPMFIFFGDKSFYILASKMKLFILQ